LGKTTATAEKRSYIKHVRAIKRTNGSRRKPNDKPKLIQRWLKNGITVGNMNVRGLSYLKLLLIMDQNDFDILCLQETWIAE
jgi:hypothetical protein